MPSETPIERLLGAVDTLNVEAVTAQLALEAAVLTVDGRRATGVEGVRRVLSDFFGGLRSTEHRVTAQWQVDDVWIAEMEALYELRDHMRIGPLPRVLILRQGPDGLRDIRFYGAHERPVSEHRTGEEGSWVRDRWIPPL